MRLVLPAVALVLAGLHGVWRWFQYGERPLANTVTGPQPVFDPYPITLPFVLFDMAIPFLVVWAFVEFAFQLGGWRR
jgi:hypothetical protein